MINERLEKVRKNESLNKKEFASKLGITAQGYNNYFKGEREIPTDLSIRINQLFNVSLDWLLTGKGEMYLGKEGNTISNGVVMGNNIQINGQNNGDITINTNRFSHKNDIREIIELLEYAPSGFLTIIKEKLQQFKKLSEF